MPELYVTNFNRNFTGVSATAAGVARQQALTHDLALVGQPLPGCPDPIPRSAALRLSRTAPGNRPFAIWHVRRNPEMRTALWARDVLRLPVKIVFTSAAIRRHSALPRWLISRMDAVIATSEEAASFVPYVHAIVPHGVDTDRFHPPEDRASAWAATGHPGTRGIATVGRIRPEKGTDIFVDTMLALLPEMPDTTALVIGRAAREHASFEADLKARIATAGLSDRILFPGEIGPDAMPGLIRALSLLVNLPRYEGYGMAPLEAMASGVPFVASDTGYFQAFSAQGTTGKVVPRDDPVTSAEACRRLLSDSESHAAASERGRELAVAEYGTAREAAAVNTVYEEVWAGG
ncbi:MAG: glycosyltransferase family 4 protein [Pseudomonadota bacterium]